MPLIANKLFFIHIPKTSGTSLYANLLREKVSIDGYPFVNSAEGISEHHYHIDLINTDKPKFAIIRNPWQRTVSEYFYRNQNKTIFDVDHFKNWLQITLIRYQKNNAVYDNHIRPQKEFIDNDTKLFCFDNLDECNIWVCDNLDIKNNFSAHKNKTQALWPYPEDPRIIGEELFNKWNMIYKKDINLYYQLTKEEFML